MSWPWSLVGLLLLLLLAAWGGAAPSHKVDDGLFPLSVVHLNDFHARFEQIDPSGSACAAGTEETCVGGIARVVAKARELLSERPNPLLLNAGDNFQGTLWYTMYGWNVTADFLNRLPWDAFTLGNHEFDRKIAGVVPFLEALEAPVVVANMDVSKEPTMEGLFEKSIVVERDGRKIGIIGIIISSTKELSSPEQVEFSEELPAVEEEAKKLKDEGVDIIVVVSHAGIEVDLLVAEADPNVDIIVGGHSHTLLYTGTPPGDGGAYDVYPIIVTQSSGRKVAVVQAGAYTRYLGDLIAYFDDEGELVSAEGNPIYLDKSVEPDPEIEKDLQPWAEGLEELATRVVGHSAVLLEQNSGVCAVGECNLGSFVADAYAHIFAGKGPEGTWTRAAIGITNSGGLRAPIAQGDVTYNDLATTIPFGNTVDYVELTGAGLRKALEQAVSSPRRLGPRAGPWARNYQGFLQVSGLHVVYEEGSDEGVHLRSVSALCHACTVPKYEPLQDDEWYPVAVNSFLGEGGDGYYVFGDEGRNYEKGLVDTDVVLEYFAVQTPVVHARDERILFAEPSDDEQQCDNNSTGTDGDDGGGAAAVGGKAAMVALAVAVVMRW